MGFCERFVKPQEALCATALEFVSMTRAYMTNQLKTTTEVEASQMKTIQRPQHGSCLTHIIRSKEAERSAIFIYSQLMKVLF